MFFAVSRNTRFECANWPGPTPSVRVGNAAACLVDIHRPHSQTDIRIRVSRPKIAETQRQFSRDANKLRL